MDLPKKWAVLDSTRRYAALVSDLVLCTYRNQPLIDDNKFLD